ncbi:MAG: anthranilate synthase component I [Deltaproteobacteria bacterium]|nr:MAG: anthranilate synthase component I [Deltaproteobacteria bacterium]
MYYPSFKEFKEKAKKGNLIPVYREILADMETPVSAFRKIDEGKYSFLLESVEGGEKWGRYSFLGTNPSVIFRSKGTNAEIIRNGRVEIIKDISDPLEPLKKLIKKYTPVEFEGLPRFYGGAVGYLGYDMVRFFELLPDTSKDELDLYDSFFLITDTLLIFDNVNHKIKIVSNAHLEEDLTIKGAYEQAIRKIEQIIKKLQKPLSTSPKVKRRVNLKLRSNFTKEEFQKIVKKGKKYVREGEIIQVVLSQRLQANKMGIDNFDLYRALRIINPSPYMFYLYLGEHVLVGSSPEVLVRLEGQKIELRPIAGTRPRGRDEQDDRRLEKELLMDPKERAEHVMLVDLGRNDVGRVARIGSVKVNEQMVIERYSHVMHIVSNIQGILQKGKDAFSVLRAAFPAGTVTGAPKIRAMEIIEELEGTKRGPYAGSVGYFSFSGNMDMCITIRTIIIKGDRIYLQAGAGIVADSRPEKEYWETINKTKALVKAVEMARNGLI